MRPSMIGNVRLPTDWKRMPSAMVSRKRGGPSHNWRPACRLLAKSFPTGSTAYTVNYRYQHVLDYIDTFHYKIVSLSCIAQTHGHIYWTQHAKIKNFRSVTHHSLVPQHFTFNRWFDGFGCDCYSGYHPTTTYGNQDGIQVWNLLQKLQTNSSLELHVHWFNTAHVNVYFKILYFTVECCFSYLSINYIIVIKRWNDSQLFIFWHLIARFFPARKQYTCASIFIKKYINFKRP